MGGSPGTRTVGTRWHALLRAKGYRLTPQRQHVLEAVAQLGHGTPEQILDAVQRTAAGVNASTVYRTLDLLEELELVGHTHLGHGPPTFFVAGGEEHLHLVCRDCGAIQECRVELVHSLVQRLATERGFVLDVGHVALFGRCSECADRAP
jgi:Fur family transcriptional regulator, ferric uptake regulator